MSITYSQMRYRIIRTIPNDILHVYYVGMRETIFLFILYFTVKSNVQQNLIKLVFSLI